ncbi:Serpentine Receptor, class I [Caenorhabditis elegans]|uniref:Serpentine Receptor, class I n=1 Tax=Caenorhabditis elegans TaxID=6239 RepID=O44676_CAEEL|nr:Serpentine Receptor, class I [Caenorhabditis elegans]CCD64466.1 Serpentine Receptor, class I [Caenorhabditis elegans]|eukprot:NP_503247.2 Serpentine Receptor, class I [Caenorhabditis elegans]
MYEIDFSEPQWLLNYYHIIGSISLLLNLFGIYLLLFKSNQLDSFKYYLLVFQLACTLTDIYLTFLMQAVTLFPTFAGYTVGILSTWFDVSSSTCVVTTAFIALIQLESLMVCFYKKHQAIATILEIHVLPDIILYTCYFLCVFCPLIFCGVVNYLNLDREQSLVFIKQNYPEHYINFSKLSHFALYVSSPVIYVVFGMAIFGGLLFFVLLLMFTIDIFSMMTNLKQKISKSTYEKHQDALRSLMVQFVTAMLCLAPPIFLTLVLIFEVPHVNVIGEILIAWFASHSSINMISLLIFFPPYRKLFVTFLKRKSA